MTSANSVLIAPPEEVRFNVGSHPRARIGYVLLATEQTKMILKYYSGQ